jgi:GDP-fucose transporter C1
MVLNDAPDLPLIFMLLQCLSTVGLLTLTSKFTDKVQVPQIEMRTAKQLAPLFVIDVAGFVFNTLCLRDVEATFFQVSQDALQSIPAPLHYSQHLLTVNSVQIARGLVLPLTIIVSAIHTRRRPSTMVIVAASIVTVGFFVGVSPFNLRTMHRPMGLVYGLLSSLSIAVHAVVLKGSLPVVGGSVTQLSYWSNFSTALALGALVLINGEAVKFVSLLGSGTWDWRVFLWGNLVTGIFGFLISIAGILSVKVTSPVTHMFSSVSHAPDLSEGIMRRCSSLQTARSVIQTLLGVKLFHDTLSGNRIASLAIIVSGTL